MTERLKYEHATVAADSDAARIARYGGVAELLKLRPHEIEQLLFYAVTVEAEPADVAASPEVVAFRICSVTR